MVVPVLATAGLAWALPCAQTTVTEDEFDLNHHPYTHSGPSLLAYALVALAAALLVA